MAENKEAVDAAAHILTGLCNATCCHKTGGKTELPNCECRQTARLVIAAIRPHILEEAARIAIGNMPDGPTGQETPYGQGRIDAAAAIRAAKETWK